MFYGFWTGLNGVSLLAWVVLCIPLALLQSKFSRDVICFCLPPGSCYDTSRRKQEKTRKIISEVKGKISGFPKPPKRNIINKFEVDIGS